MRNVSRRVRWIGGGVLLAVAVATTLVVVLANRGRQLPPPRARQYRDVDACLLTGPGGLADPQAGAVWAGMQDASLATKARVSYLSVVGPETEAAALPFAQSLIQRHCTVILAVGPVEVGAVAKEAPRYLAVKFVLIGGSGAGSNVSVVPAGSKDEVRHNVGQYLHVVLG
jgi:basic membrane lipoprotein Med (substrate-binding protein (PBP1-ABC) superfamily)